MFIEPLKIHAFAALFINPLINLNPARIGQCGQTVGQPLPQICFELLLLCAQDFAINNRSGNLLGEFIEWCRVVQSAGFAQFLDRKAHCVAGQTVHAQQVCQGLLLVLRKIAQGQCFRLVATTESSGVLAPDERQCRSLQMFRRIAQIATRLTGFWGFRGQCC